MNRTVLSIVILLLALPATAEVILVPAHVEQEASFLNIALDEW